VGQCYPCAPNAGTLYPTIVILDPKIGGIAVGISLLSCLPVATQVTLYLLPVNGRHL